MESLIKGSRPLPPTPDSLFDACAEQTFVEKTRYDPDPVLVGSSWERTLAFRRCVSLCGRLKLIRKKIESKFLRWPRNGVRRSSSGFVGAEGAPWKCCCQSGKTDYKNAIVLSACCFSMRFRGENVKTHVGNVWTSLRARFSSSEFVGLKVLQTA